MIDLDTLRIADSYLWLGTGQAVAEHIGCNQSTISRTIRRVEALRQDLIGLESENLLQMEREIHQKWRFAQGKGLRIHSYRWTNHLIRHRIPEGWTTNPLRVSATKTPGLSMVEGRVIDAICAPYPLVAYADRNVFALIELYTTVLQLFAHKNGALAKEKGLSASDIGSATRLASLSYVPVEASECSKKIDAEIFGGKAAQQGAAELGLRYWGTPLTAIISGDLQPISHRPLCPYAEYLVVLKEWENHPLVVKLQEAIAKSLIDETRNNPASELLKIVA